MKTHTNLLDDIYMGVDVGGTTINIAAVTAEGKILLKHALKTADFLGNSNQMLEAIADEVDKILNELNINADSIHSIGLGFPGTVDSKKGIVVFAPNIFLKNVDVKTPLSKKFDCPIFLSQDSRASAWGEFCVGQNQGVSNMASITIGTGIGCGLIINGMLYHGSFNTAGEFGHQLFDVDGPACNCGRKGCLEAYCAGKAIIKAGESIGKDLSVKDIYTLASKGNEAALEITKKVIHYLGTGIVNLENLLSLELITISGGISNAPEDLLLNPLKEFVKAHVYPTIADKLVIRKSFLEDDAPLIGAALQDESTEF